jgi:hypothetical protein
MVVTASTDRLRILFIGTDASVSGAPQVLERLETSFSAHRGIHIGTLLARAASG